MVRVRALLVVAGLVAIAGGLYAQAPPAAQPSGRFEALAPIVASAASSAQVADEPATLTYTNRPVVVFRATVMTRPPAARAAGAIEQLRALVEQDPHGRVTTRVFADAVVVGIGDRPVFVLFAADLALLSGETLTGKSADAAARLDQAFREAVELRTPGRLLTGIGFATTITLIYGLAIWALVLGDRRLAAAASRATERRLEAMSVGEIMAQVRAPMLVRRMMGLVCVVLGLLLTYAWLTAVLRRFPYTRPWGESLRGALLSAGASAGRSILDEVPNLLTVLAIALITRFLVRLVTVAFDAAEHGRVALPGVHAETAPPTRRIVVALLWVGALVASYEYLPGSESDAFKGVTIFLGLIVSLGSTGLMNQVMSGLMVTYSRAVRLSDFVRIGEIEGTVIHLGTLSTKIRTAKNEEVTIPNAVVVSHATTNFSRYADSDGVFMPTSVTIGYDTPWRQVQALLLLAAERTPGIRQTPAPVVMQTDLGDFSVRYALLVCLEHPARRIGSLAALHANILDAFNEYDVQIMSPAYEADPADRKLVPPSRWHAAPAHTPEELR